MSRNDQASAGLFSIPVLVAALGYFVDIYDLLLFGIIRKTSLRSLGLSEEMVLTSGEFIISIQMVGLLLGGILWGVMGDKKGRLSVLFGSIILYSLANIASGMVQTVNQYALLRFIAGVGLAGELGAGITLVSELLPKEKRGLGTSMVAGFGLTGAIVAYFISKQFDWRICYYIGGGMGLLLLLLRISVFESNMFNQVKETNVSRGNFFMFFTNKDRFFKYIKCILIGLPTWYVIGILVTFSDQFGKNMGIAEPIDPGRAIMFAYVGISLGDIAIGFVSQALKSRRKALFIFYIMTMICIALFFLQRDSSASVMYLICAALGFSTGFWAIFVTMAAEQFGTNLRATAATTVPNMVRGALPLMILLFKSLREGAGFITGGIITGIIIMVITLVAAYFTKETFGKDLRYVE
ncbi:MFS transporter [Segetibacter sp.]|jgi:putative MFS transporter|uniref:MFS transporter n=1 Tax=Segetibacter sp. TaxID=2231182 RepID=UPI0026254ABC|nr:MFS transporter [Segetibacter sp.]MCW3080348.1 transporter [Segetibacter sp.]